VLTFAAFIAACACWFAFNWILHPDRSFPGDGIMALLMLILAPHFSAVTLHDLVGWPHDLTFAIIVEGTVALMFGWVLLAHFRHNRSS
jgi:hypothetical protein